MASAETVTLALARLRADRPGLGLEDSVDAHWIEWFAGAEYPDGELAAGVAHYLESTPARTWPTVAEIEQMIARAVKLHRRAELEAGACSRRCFEGLVYEKRLTPYDHEVLVPCECPKGRQKLEGLRAWDEKRARARERQGEI